MASPVRPTVLVVDDDPGICALVKAVLADEGYAVCIVGASLRGAMDAVRRQSPTLMLLDIVGSQRDIEALVAEAREVKPDLAVTLFTALSKSEAADLRQRLPGVDLLSKPFDIDELVAAVRRAHLLEDAGNPQP